MAEFPALPLWTDAYLGDTFHLTTIEHGAYLLILMAMWRNGGSLPDDDAHLAKCARMTRGQWQRIGPTIRAFLTARDGVLTQGRLTDEYNAVRQHSRKQSDNAKARWLKPKEKGDAVAMPNTASGNAPLPLPIPTYKEEEESARAKSPDLFLTVLTVCGLNGGPLPTYWMPPAAEVHVNRWRDLGLTEADIIEVVRSEQRNRTDKPRGPKAFDAAMQRLAAAKNAPIPEITPQAGGRANEQQAFDRSINTLAADLSAGTIRLDYSDRDPFAPRRG